MSVREVTMWSTGIYTQSYTVDGPKDDKELMACGECGTVVRYDHSLAHMNSHREA